MASRKNNYNFKSVYRQADREIEQEFKKAAPIASGRDEFDIKPFVWRSRKKLT